MAIKITNEIRGGIKICRRDNGRWDVKQQRMPHEHDNAQLGMCLRIENAVKSSSLEIHVTWAEYRWMALRRFGYLKSGNKWQVIEGKTTPTKTVYNVTAPKGISLFGPVPWYSNRDADLFLKELGKHCQCKVKNIGCSAEGRPLQRLSINSSSAKKNVIILARIHAGETSGSFAVEATARYLLSGTCPEHWFDKYRFHLYPVANPDGVAHGLKLTRIGPVLKYDMDRGSMVSDDPTIMALRKDIIALRPALLVDHHSYLFGAPMIFALDRDTALAMVERLVCDDRERKERQNWQISISSRHSPPYLRDYCHTEFGTLVAVSEIPWAGRKPSEIEDIGKNFFCAAMGVLESG